MIKSKQDIGKALFAVCGMWLILLGIYFATMRPALLPEDYRYLDMNAVVVSQTLPQLGPWLRHVFIVMGGFISGAGVLVIALVTTPGKVRIWAMLVAGLLTVTAMSTVNFLIQSDFRWVLVVPALIWWGAVAFVIASRAESQSK